MKTYHILPGLIFIQQALLMGMPVIICKIHLEQILAFIFKGKLSDSFTNYNYVGNTKVSVSIKKT